IRVGNVTLTADSQKERMNARGIHGMDRMYSGNHRGDDRAGKFMDDLAKVRVFLRRPANDSERPNRAISMRNVFDVKHGGRIDQTVVSQMISEGPFGQ